MKKKIIIIISVVFVILTLSLSIFSHCVNLRSFIYTLNVYMQNPDSHIEYINPTKIRIARSIIGIILSSISVVLSGFVAFYIYKTDYSIPRAERERIAKEKAEEREKIKSEKAEQTKKERIEKLQAELDELKKDG